MKTKIVKLKEEIKFLKLNLEVLKKRLKIYENGRKSDINNLRKSCKMTDKELRSLL